MHFTHPPSIFLDISYLRARYFVSLRRRYHDLQFLAILANTMNISSDLLPRVKRQIEVRRYPIENAPDLDSVVALLLADVSGAEQVRNIDPAAAGGRRVRCGTIREPSPLLCGEACGGDRFREDGLEQCRLLQGNETTTYSAYSLYYC
jgi:hypothetical protein